MICFFSIQIQFSRANGVSQRLSTPIPFLHAFNQEVQALFLSGKKRKASANPMIVGAIPFDNGSADSTVAPRWSSGVTPVNNWLVSICGMKILFIRWWIRVLTAQIQMLFLRVIEQALFSVLKVRI